MSKIVVSNCWSFYNKGDAAITMGTISLIKKISPNSEVVSLAFDHESFEEHKEEFGESVTFMPMPSFIAPLDRINLFLYGICRYVPALSDVAGLVFIVVQLILIRALRGVNSTLNEVLLAIEDADLIIAVGGNYLYSHAGLYNHLIPLVYAKILRQKPVILLGHSVGPFRNNMMMKLVRYLFERVDYIFLRESLSEEYLIKEMNLELGRIKTIGDMCFILKDKVFRKKELFKSDVVNVGISLRKWLFDDPELFRNYVISVTELISYLISNGYNVVIVPFSYTSGQEYDYDLCKNIYEKTLEKDKTRVSMMFLKEDSPISVINKLIESELHLFVGTRLHSTLLASIAGIPPIIISYQHFKAFGISKQLGLEDFVIKISDVDSSQLISMVEKLIERYDDIRNQVASSVDNIYDNILHASIPYLKIYMDDYSNGGDLE